MSSSPVLSWTLACSGAGGEISPEDGRTGLVLDGINAVRKLISDDDAMIKVDHANSC